MERDVPRISHGAASGGSDRAAMRPSQESGYAMAALLVGMSVMAVMMSAAMPVWSTAAKRMKEDELVFRGEQYAHAIALYQRKYANALPPSLDVLVNEHFLRKKYLDPITGQEFQVLTGAVGQGAPGMGPGGRGAAAPGPQGRGGPAPAGGFGSGRSTSGPSGTTGFQGSGSGSSGIGTGVGTTTGIGSTTGIGGTTGVGAGGRGATGSPFGGVGGAGGAGGIVGVASKSKEKSLRVYNGRDVYNEWTFVPVQRQVQAGGQGQAAPGLPGGRGQATPGQQNQGSRGTGSSPFGGNSDPFRPSSTGPGSTSPFGR